jgi:tetratricopeptide (TPR) repeat protein
MAHEKLVSLLTDWAKEKLKNKEEVIALLKRFGYERPENNFESLYAHSLVALSNQHKDQLAAVLRDEEVIAAFRHYWTTHEFEPFSLQFSTRVEALKRDYGMPDLDRESELKGFTDVFRDLVRRVATPIEQEQTALLYDVREGVKRLERQQAQPAPSVATPASNIPIHVPYHFMGRDDSLAAISAALLRSEGSVAITALHGLRGVGKTTLAAAYAERHRSDYRATWWIRAQADTSMRADVAALGVRLGWVAADEKEERALAAVAERLRHEGEGILLIYDNALDADSLRPYLPRGGAAHVLVTSNAHAWRGIAELVELRTWPKEIGADFLIARTGRRAEREAAEALSEALGGLALAHEQAGAYCDRLNIALADYGKRFDTAPAQFMDDTRHAPAEYHDGLTVAKTFALAIEEAARLHPAAEPLIVHAALLPPEPIPLFLLSEGREMLGEPLANGLAEAGLDEAVAALRAFALVDAETIADERDPTITTDCIRLHRLVRQMAAARREGQAREEVRRALIEAAKAVFPKNSDAPQTWPRVRRLEALILGLVSSDVLPTSSETSAACLLDRAAIYCDHALADLKQAQRLCLRALAIRENALGPEHPDTARTLDDLAFLLAIKGDTTIAQHLYERALAIREKVLGPDHLDTARSRYQVARMLHIKRDFAAARQLYERACAIFEKVLGPEHPDTGAVLGNLAMLLNEQGDYVAARALWHRVVAVSVKVFGPEHPNTASVLIGLASVQSEQDDVAAARVTYERALAIREMVLGPDHADIASVLNGLAFVLSRQGNLAAAQAAYERALAIDEKVFGAEHPKIAEYLRNLAFVLSRQGNLAAAQAAYERAFAIDEKVFGPEHPITKDNRIDWQPFNHMIARSLFEVPPWMRFLQTAPVIADGLDPSESIDAASVLRTHNDVPTKSE